MKRAFKESLEKGAGSYHQMKPVAHTHLPKRECSLQEAVYEVMLDLWLRKVFPGVLYANINIPEKHVRMMLSKKKLFELLKYSTDIDKRNMVNRYMISPKDSIFEHLCYALFIKRYQLQPKPIENDSIFMFYSFHDECKLKVGESSSYSSKLSEPRLIEVINDNKSLVEPYSDLVNDVFLNYQTSVLVGIPSHSRKMMMLKIN